MSEYDNPDFFDPVDEINKILSDDRQALPSVYKKVEKLDVVGEGSALVASANEKTLPSRRVGRFEMLEVLERSLGRTVLNIANPGQRVFTAIRELSDFVNMATTGAQPKVANAHRDLLPVGHPLSTKQHNFSTEEVAQARADWMSADPRISEAFRPLVASAFVAPASSLEREYVIAKLEATNANEVPRDIILSLTAGVDPYGGGNSFLARSTRAKAQRRDRRGRFAWMGGGARVWLGKQFSARSTLFRFAGYNSQNDSFDLEGLPNTPYQGKIISVPASKVEAIKAILPELPGLKAPASKSVAKDIIVDPASLELRDAPTGWTKVSSENGVDTFRSADGWIATRYPNSASAPNEPSIKRVRGANVDKSIDPGLPVYHIAKGSNDGLVTDKPFAVTQSWGDTQALISRYDKKTDPKPKATLEEQPEEFLEGWAKDEKGYIPADYNPYGYYEGRRDPAIGNATYTDPSGRFVAVSMAPEKLVGQQPRADIEAIKKQQQAKIDNVRKYVAESGKPVSTFDGAQKWDGDVSNLWRLEKVRSDGKKEIVGYYQDLDDIERDTEIPKDLEQGKDFYEEVIANTLQYGGNSVDFVDGSNPEQGYLVAHEADVLKQDGTIGKREQLVSPKDFMDPVDGPKILRDYVLKNQEKLMEKGFYLGTWTDTVDVKDANGKVTGQREMVFLDVSEYVEQFDDAIDAAEKRGEIAIYGAAEGKSYYTADEMKRREVIRSTPKFDEERANEVRKKADEIIDEEDKWFRDNRSVWENFERDNRISLWSDTDGNWESPSPTNLGRSEPVPNPEVAKISPEIYGHLKRRFDADKSRNSVFQEYIRSVFEMPDGMDPGSRLFGLDDKQDLLDIRNRYVGDDDATLKMNAKLREGEDATSRVKSTDRLINKSKLKQDTLLYRGAWLSPELVDEMGIGDSFFDRGFQSAGLDVATANGYLDFRAEKSQGKKRVVFRVLAPKGMNAIHVGDDEVIMRRNTKMTIVRKTELNGTTYIDVDTEPQTKEEINARIQGRVPRPEPSESSSELPGNDGGGTDGLGDGGPFPVNYSPKSTVEGPEQATRVTDPNTAIWGSLSNDVAGVSQSEIIDEAIAMKTTPDRLMSQVLKANVAKSLEKKLKDVDNKEFLEMAVALKMYFRDDLFWDDDSLKNIATIPVVYRSKDGPELTRPYYNTIQGLVQSGPMGDTLPQDLIDRLNTGRISRKDAKEVVRLMNESGRAPYADIVFVNKDSEEYMGTLREKVVSNLVGQWASTSNGGEPLSLAIQDLAMKEFDIKNPAEWRVSNNTLNDIENIKTKNSNLIRRFLRAQYELTQEYFQKKGISKVTLYRGIKNFTAHDMTESTFPSSRGFTAAIKLRPLSAWSTSEGVSVGFARGADTKIFRKEYDVKDIFAFPGTGVGCYDEKEMVVIGGVTSGVDIADPTDIYNIAYNSPEPAPITYKEDQVSQEPDLPVNNAPAEEETFKDFTPIDIKPYLQKREEIRKEVTKAREEAEEFQKSIDSEAMLSLAKKTKDGSYIPNETMIEYYGKNGRAMYAKVNKWLKLYDKLSDFDKKFLDSMFDRDSKAKDPSKDNSVFLWGMSNDSRMSWYSSGGTKFNEVGNDEWKKRAFSSVSRLISESSLKTDAELYRGEWLPKDLVESVAVGDTIYFDNIQELSYLPNVPKRQLDDTEPRYKSSYLGEPKATSIKLNCPKGTNALYLGEQAYDSKNGEQDQAMTRAVLLRPDVKMKLVSKTEKDGVTYLEFDVEPKTKEEIDNNISGLVKQGDEESAFQPEIPVNNAPDTYIPTGTDDGGIEPDPDFFELEGVDVYSPEIYKAEVSRNLADSPEMQEVGDSEMIKLSDWFGILRSDELEWGENEEKFIDNIRLIELNNGQWVSDYEFTDILYYIEQNMKAGGVEPFEEGSVLKRVVESYIDRENGVISEADLAQFFEDYNEHFGVDYADSYLVPDIKDP